MKLHANARSCPHARQVLVQRVLQEGWSLAGAAEAVGLSRTSARRWIQRYLAEGKRGLHDRTCRPGRSPNRTRESVEARFLALRRTRLVVIAIARQLGLARSTVGAILRRHGLGRLRALDPKEKILRYERESPGELLHLHTKKLARIEGDGQRIHGERGRKNRGNCWEFAHTAIDDHTRISYVEVLPNERCDTTADFLKRAVRFFERKGITIQQLLTDNGMGYRSSLVNAVCVDRSIEHLWTKPYTPNNHREGRATRANAATRVGLRPRLPILT